MIIKRYFYLLNTGISIYVDEALVKIFWTTNVYVKCANSVLSDTVTTFNSKNF